MTLTFGECGITISHWCQERVLQTCLILLYVNVKIKQPATIAAVQLNNVNIFCNTRSLEITYLIFTRCNALAEGVHHQRPVLSHKYKLEKHLMINITVNKLFSTYLYPCYADRRAEACHSNRI